MRKFQISMIKFSICAVFLCYTTILIAQPPCGVGVGTILFEEDFEGEPDASTTGTDINGVPWTATCAGCVGGDFFETDSNSGNAIGCNGTKGLRGNDTNGPGVFNVSGIDITGCEVVYFAFDYCSTGYDGSGNLECFSECTFGGGCPGIPAEGVSDPACNNCWDFLYGELDWGSGTAQQILLGDDCTAPAFGSTGNAVCGSTDMDGNPIDPIDLMNVDINIVMAMWAGTENMVIDNVVLICYSAEEVAACADPTLAEICPEPCGYPEPIITFVESCGSFNMTVGAVDESAASGTGTVATFTTAPVDPIYPVVGGTIITGAEMLPANGTTPYWVQICDVADPTCCSEFGPIIAPVGQLPDCGVFPANGN